MRQSFVRLCLGSVGLLLGFSLLSCADDPNAPGEPVPTSMIIVSGSNQNGVVGTELAQPLIVEVRDGSNNPLPGAVVNFVVVRGGGTVFAGAAETDLNGRAQDYWTLGTSTADSQRVEVRSVAGSNGAKEVHGVFTAVAVPGAVASVTIPVDTLRLSWIGDTTTVPALAADQYGNPVVGAPIRYVTGTGAGAFTLDSITGLATAVHNGDRRVRASVGAAGDTVRVVVAPVLANLEPGVDSIIVHSLNLPVVPPVVGADSGGTAMPAGALRWRSLNSGILQVVDTVTGATIGLQNGVGRVEFRSLDTGVRDTIRIRVRQVVDSVHVSPPTSLVPIGDTVQLAAFAYDSNAVAIAGATFTWSSDDSTRVRVDQLGRAFGVGYGATTIRALAVAAPVAGAGVVTVRNADTLSIVLTAGSGQAGIVAQPLGQLLAARVVNQFGEGVPDVPVVWWSANGVLLTPTNPVSLAEGHVAAAAVLDTVAGIKQAFATIGHDTVAFGMVARPDVPAEVLRASLVSQTDTVGDLAVSVPRVRVVDRYGNGVPGLEVRFLPRNGSLATAATQITNAEGRAAVGSWQLDTVPGIDSMVVTVRDTVTTSFRRLVYVAQAVQDSASVRRSLLFATDTVRERDSTRIDVQLVDRFGNPLIQGDGVVTMHSTAFGAFDPVVNDGDGSYRVSFRPNQARGTTSIYARLDGDSIWAVRQIHSRSYQLRWQGLSTEYAAAANWSAPGGPPSTLDSLYIPASLPNYPQLIQNTSVENVFIEQGATLNVSSFDLTVSRSFTTGSTIGGTGLSGTGRLLMTGIGTLNGDMRHLRITEGGRSSLDGNLNVTGGRIVVQGGRLRSQGYRIRVRPS